MSFAAALYGATGARRSCCMPAKWESFGSHFNAVIVTEHSTLHPYARLNGQLAIESHWLIIHNGLRVQLEAQCMLKFHTKSDNRVYFCKKYDNLLEGTGEMPHYSTYLESPVRTDILPQKIDPDEYELPAGTHRYRFNLQDTGEFLPAPFKNSYGSLHYKLVAYMLNGTQWVAIGDKVLGFSGYHNLSQNLEALKPIQIERSVKKSIFSSKKLVSATIHLESCGYLPGEDLPFKLHISNPKCLPIKMWVELTQRMAYNVDGAKKATSAVLDSSTDEISEPGAETVWSDVLKVHKATSPYYCIHPMFTVSHLLQFNVKAEDYAVIVKGKIPIFIGSTREPVEFLKLAANSLNAWDNRGLPARRGSTSAAHSDCSKFKISTQPPPYFQISSRIPSLETLLPQYDSADDDDFRSVQKGQRKLSGLEFHVVPPDDETSGTGSQHDITAATTPSPVGDDD